MLASRRELSSAPPTASWPAGEVRITYAFDNDTPRIAALLLVTGVLKIQWGLVAVAVAMAVGGLLNARKVADTMANKITGMNPGQGFAANLATALLVNTASYPVCP